MLRARGNTNLLAFLK